MEPINGKYLTIYADDSVPVHAQVVPILGLHQLASDIWSFHSTVTGYNERAYNLIDAWQHDAGNISAELESARQEVARLRQLADTSHHLESSEELLPHDIQGLIFEISKAWRYADDALGHLDEYLKTAGAKYSEDQPPYYGDDGPRFADDFGGSSAPGTAAHHVYVSLTTNLESGKDDPVDDNRDVDQLLNELGARLAHVSKQSATSPEHWPDADAFLATSDNSAEQMPTLEQFKPQVSLVVYWPTLNSVNDRGFARIPGVNYYDHLPEVLAGAGLHELYGKISSRLEAVRKSAYEMRGKQRESNDTAVRPPILEEESFFVTADYAAEQLPVGEGAPAAWVDRMAVDLVLRRDAVESVNSGVLRSLARPKAAKCYFIQAGKLIALSSNREFNEYDPITQAVLRIAAYQETVRELPPPASGCRHVGEIERVPHRTRKDAFRVTTAPAGSRDDIRWVTDLVTKHTDRPSYTTE